VLSKEDNLVKIRRLFYPYLPTHPISAGHTREFHPWPDESVVTRRGLKDLRFQSPICVWSLLITLKCQILSLFWKKRLIKSVACCDLLFFFYQCRSWPDFWLSEVGRYCFIFFFSILCLWHYTNVSPKIFTNKCHYYTLIKYHI